MEQAHVDKKKIKAIQWVPGRTFLKDVLYMFGGLGAMESSSISVSHGILWIEMKNRGNVFVSPGDWIFRNEEGYMDSCSSEEFESAYEAVKE